MGNILLTGGAGFIGSHIAVELLEAGYGVVVADNFSNSSPKVIERIERISGKKVDLFQIDATDRDAMRKVFSAGRIDGVIHLAGFKAVGESVHKPLEYYRNNVGSAITLMEVMKEFGCRKLVFSSSATVYGADGTVPYKEDARTGGCTNPYGWTKYMIEQIIRDSAQSFDYVILRYFNPIGAHKSGLIGEMPNGVPNNLMPYIAQVAAGLRTCLNIFGDDYPTPDGTGVRDYIHVTDLARGHVAAIESNRCGVYNLGTGRGYSVLEVVKAFERVNGIKIPYAIAPRRDGDIAEVYADVSKAEKELGWHAQFTLDDMVRDTWNWQKNNPDGYNG